MLRHFAITSIVLALSGTHVYAQEHEHTPRMTHPADSSFDALKERGGKAMRVDQDEAAHVFDALPDGGRIELQATNDDSTAIAGIREHFKDIETAFRKGDFAIPMFVHDGEVPGTAVMTARKERITFVRRGLPRGAELRLQTGDPEVIKAIRDFMNFQRSEHRAEGRP